MANISSEIIKVARPVHWVKNGALFAAIIFSGNLTSGVLFLKVVLAFISFSLATSATYIFNDILDVEHDRLHPIKKNRPLAKKSLSMTHAIFAMVAFSLTSIYLALGLNSLFMFSLRLMLVRRFYRL